MNYKKLFIVPVLFSICACSEGNANKIKFRHQQGTNDYGDYCYYDDSIFDNDSTTFNPKLASASIAFAMASFASMSIESYEYKSQNAKNLLNKMGFSHFTTNHWFTVKPETDSIGLLAAYKKIGEYTVVAFGIRGAAYFSEWASNFTLGNREDGYHEGFRTAADNYIDFAKSYIQEENITGDIKIWTAGYSRAGATCNLASGLLTRAILDGQKPFGEQVNITKEHFYSYCFEAPKGAPKTKDSSGNVIVKSADYNNIFNLLNINDVVPLVAMGELGFTRYGIDMYLPDPLTVYDYEPHFKNMKGLYNAIDNHEQLGDYRIDNFQYNSFKGLKVTNNANAHHMTQGLFLREVISDLTLEGISQNGKIALEECLKYYDENVQTGLRNLFKIIYSSEYFKGSLMDIGLVMVTDIGIIQEVDYLISDLTIEGPPAFIKDFKPLLTRALNKLTLDVDVKETVNNITNFAGVIGHLLFGALSNGKAYQLMNFINVDNVKSIASGHYPELCAAHVRALDEQYVKNPFTDYEKMSGQYYRLFIENTDTSISISHNNKQIVRINDGGEIDNHISYIKRSSGYEIYLPYYETYRVELADDSDIELSYWNSKLEEYVDIDFKPSDSRSFVIGQ